MKKIYSLLVLTLFAFTAAAQNTTTYFMKGATMRSDFNPALAPTRGYFNLPGAGSMQVGLLSPIALDHLFYNRGDGLVTLLDTSVSSQDALRDLSAHNLLDGDVRAQLLGFGAFTKNGKNFWSFSLNLRSQVEADIPYSFVEFFKTGKDTQIKDMRTDLNAWAEAAFTYSFPISKKIYLGARLKFLTGVARMETDFEQMDIALQADRWEIQTKGMLEMSGITAEVDENGNFKAGDIEMDKFKIAGMGAAIDLGITYDIVPDLQFSLGVTDLGFIAWNKKSATYGESADRFTYDGMEVVDGVVSSPDFDMDFFEFQQRDGKGTTRSLRSTINAGVEYDLWKKRIGLGLLYSARFNSFRTRHSLTGSVNFYPAHWANITASYLYAGDRGSSMGLALNLTPGFINLMLATDLVTAKVTPQMIPVKRKALNFTFGLGFPIGRRSMRSFDAIGPVKKSARADKKKK